MKNERLVSKMEGKTYFSRSLKQSDGLTWLILITSPLFYDRSTPLRAACVARPWPGTPCTRRAWRPDLVSPAPIRSDASAAGAPSRRWACPADCALTSAVRSACKHTDHPPTSGVASYGWLGHVPLLDSLSVIGVGVYRAPQHRQLRGRAELARSR